MTTIIDNIIMIIIVEGSVVVAVVGAAVVGAAVGAAVVGAAVVGAAVSLKFSTFASRTEGFVNSENNDPASLIVLVPSLANPQKFGSQSTSESWGFPDESKFLVLFQHTY